VVSLFTIFLALATPSAFAAEFDLAGGYAQSRDFWETVHAIQDQTGNIAVLGANSIGVVAQSLGGGGGWVEGIFAGNGTGTGAGGAIDLRLSGSVFAAGLNSTGIFAQSQGSTGTGNIRVTANNLVRGGGGTGAGIRLAGGAANLIQLTSGSDPFDGRYRFAVDLEGKEAARADRLVPHEDRARPADLGLARALGAGQS